MGNALIEELALACLDEIESRRFRIPSGVPSDVTPARCGAARAHVSAEQLDEVIKHVCRDHPGLQDQVSEMLSSIREMGFLDEVAETDGAVTEEIPGFRIEQVLGRGGMGVVYLAEQEQPRRKVALKTIRSEFLASDHARERFRREAELAARFDAPGLCKIYSVGEHRGQLYQVMEYLPGRTLAEEIAACAVFDRDAIRRHLAWVAQVARTLHVLHTAGTIHRDVKPGNLQIVREQDPAPAGRSRDRVVLLDFGLAIDDDSVSLTRSRDVIGTLAYMSPEQAHVVSFPLGPATDVYSLGVTLYEAVTGQLPYDGKPAEILQKMRQDRVIPPRQVNPLVSRDLALVIERALDQDPRRRFRTTMAFAEELDRVLAGEPISIRPQNLYVRTRRWVVRNPVAATAILALTLLLATAALMLSVVLQEQSRADAENLANLAAVEPEPPVRLRLAYDALKSREMIATRRAVNHALHQPPEVWRSAPFRATMETISVSDDGARVVAMDVTGLARVYRVPGWEMLRERDFTKEFQRYREENSGYPPYFSRAVVDPRGTRVILCPWGTVAFLWRVDSDRVEDLAGHGHQISDAAFGPGDETIYTSAGDGCIRKFARESSGTWEGEVVHRFGRVAMSVQTLADGSMVWGSSDGRVLRCVGGEAPVEFSVPGVSPQRERPHVDLDADRMVIRWGDHAALFRLDGGLVAKLDAPGVPTLCAAIARPHSSGPYDRKVVITGHEDGFARSWDLETGELTTTSYPFEGAPVQVRVSRDGGRRMFFCRDRVVRIFDPWGRLTCSFGGFDNESERAFDFLKDGATLLTGGERKVVRAWRIHGGLTPRNVHASPVRIVHILPVGDQLLLSNGIGALLRCEGSDVRAFAGLSHLETQLDVSPDGRRILASTIDGRAYVLDAASGAVLWRCKEVREGQGARNAASGCAFLSDRHVLVAHADQLEPHGAPLRLFRLDETEDGGLGGTELTRVTLGALELHYYRIDVDRQRHRVVACCYDHKVRCWDIKLDQDPPVFELSGCADIGAFPWAVEFSPDGNRIVSAGYDGVPRLHAADATLLRALKPHNAALNHVCFDPTGSRVASASVDGVIRVYSVETGEVLDEFTTKGSAESVAFTPDGERLLSATAGGRLIEWVLSSESLESIAAERLGWIEGK